MQKKTGFHKVDGPTIRNALIEYITSLNDPDLLLKKRDS